MGTWNLGLFSNDTTSDVKNTYIQFLKQQVADEDAYKKTYEEYKELLETDEEPLFWYALAETQWNVGRLTPVVRDKALKFISQKGGIALFEKNADITKWEKTLRKLKIKLDSPMPPSKKFSKAFKFISNPWNVGDVYAYRFHTSKAVNSGLLDKYILLQKIGNIEYYKGTVYSVIQVFDKVFDSIPELSAVENIRILPQVHSPSNDGPRNISEYIPSFEYFFKSTALLESSNAYPKKYLTFVGNKDTIEEHLSGNKLTDFYWDKNKMEDWIIEFYLSWKDTEY